MPSLDCLGPLCTAARLYAIKCCIPKHSWLTWCTCCRARRMVLPDNYDDLPAVEKQDVLWRNCTAAPYDAAAIAANSRDAPAFEAVLIFVPQHTHTTFLNASDEMPTGRQKVIHAHGR